MGELGVGEKTTSVTNFIRCGSSLAVGGSTANMRPHP